MNTNFLKLDIIMINKETVIYFIDNKHANSSRVTLIELIISKYKIEMVV